MKKLRYNKNKIIMNLSWESVDTHFEKKDKKIMKFEDAFMLFFITKEKCKCVFWKTKN